MSGSIPPGLWRAKQLAANRLLRPNFSRDVLAVGIGRSLVANGSAEAFCVRIYVESKFRRRGVPEEDLLPRSIYDIPTEVIEVSPLAVPDPLPSGMARRSTAGPGSRIRVNTSASNVNSRAVGTLGAVVKDGAGGLYILGCNHTLATNGRVPPGTEIVLATSTGLEENGEPIALFRNHFVHISHDHSNHVDCALASLENPAKVNPEFPEGIRAVSTECLRPIPGMKVAKFGGATGLTFGFIVDVNADVLVDYGFGTFRFTDQVLIDAPVGSIFATSGDSGAIVVDMGAKQATAMVFAEAGRFSVACPLSEILKRLGERLNTSEDKFANLEGKNSLSLVID